MAHLLSTKIKALLDDEGHTGHAMLVMYLTEGSPLLSPTLYIYLAQEHSKQRPFPVLLLQAGGRGRNVLRLGFYANLADAQPLGA